MVTELRETCCLVDHSLIVKGNKLRNSRWRGIHRTGCVGGRYGTSRSLSLTFPKSACVHQPRSCPDPVWGFLWRSHHTSTIDSVTGCCDCFNQKRFGLSQTWSGEEGVQGRDRKFQSSNHVLSYPGRQRPPLERRHSLKITSFT